MRTDTPLIGLGVAAALAVVLGARAVSAEPVIGHAVNPPSTEYTALPPSARTGSSGIVFGKPVVISEDGMSAVLVLVSNTTDEVKSFTIKATLRRANTTVGVLAGVVDTLRAHETRAADLIAFDGLPATCDRIELSIDQIVTSAPATHEADVAARLKLGVLSMDSAGSSGRLRLPVTNNDIQPHSFSVRATFLLDGDLVGDAVGYVSDLGPGQTSQVMLLPLGDTTSYDQILLAIDSISP